MAFFFYFRGVVLIQSFFSQKDFQLYLLLRFWLIMIFWLACLHKADPVGEVWSVVARVAAQFAPARRLRHVPNESALAQHLSDQAHAMLTPKNKKK